MTTETAVTLAAMLMGFASTAVNLRAWSKRPRSSRRWLYLWSGIVTFAFAMVYLLGLTGHIYFSVLIDSLILRGLVILVMLGLLLHGLVDV